MAKHKNFITDHGDASELDAEWFKSARPASEVLPELPMRKNEQSKISENNNYVDLDDAPDLDEEMVAKLRPAKEVLPELVKRAQAHRNRKKK